jgi:anti-sigma-K factor RskA
MTRYSRDELLELAAAYALGATSPDETAAIEAELPKSPELAAEVSSFRDVAAGLAQLEPVRPSMQLGSRLMERIHSEPGPRTARAPLALRTPWWRRGSMWAIAASVVALVGLGAESFVLWNRWQYAQAKLEYRERVLNTLLHGEKDLRVIHLKAADTVKGPGIQFFWNESHASGVVHAFRLPPAPANHAYQIWVMINGRPTSMRVFNSDPDGHALVENLALPASSRGATAVLVTLEPAGGSPQPTTEPFLKGVVPATY